MEQNLFEELQERKQHLVSIAKKATEYGWITLERQQEIIDKLENDTLTIGVIGQMKCGKSTFLNSFVFEDDVLLLEEVAISSAPLLNIIMLLYHFFHRLSSSNTLIIS